jgi:photosystem II stability/assembly factor-like uncharacterized protein
VTGSRLAGYCTRPLHLIGLLVVVGCLTASGDGAASATGQATSSGIACGSGQPASFGSCLVALSFVSGTLGYALSAPGVAGTPLVLGKSTDAGVSWSSIGQVPGLNTAAPQQPHLLFTDTATGFAWGASTLEQTDDGGAHWAKVRLPGRFLSLVRQRTTLWAATSTCAVTSPIVSPPGCSIRVFSSGDAGRSWSPAAAPAVPFGQAQLAVAGESVDLAAWEPASNAHGASASPRLLVGSRRGASWTSSPLPCPNQDQFPGQLAAAPGSSTLWLVCSGQADAGLALYQSSSEGSRWTRTFSASGPDGQGFALDAKLEELQPVSASRAYALTELNGLLVTHDGGRRWSAASSPAQTGTMSGFRGTLDVFGERDVWVALWTTVPGHVALFHTTSGGTSWSSPVLSGAPPVTFPENVRPCQSSQLVARFFGTQGEAGSWLSTIDIADESNRPCSLDPPATLELVNADGTNQRSVRLAMRSDVPLTAGSEIPSLGSGIEPGTQLASILVTWPNLAIANSLLGGDGGATCPVALFTPNIVRMDFSGHTLLVTPTAASASVDAPVAPIEPICGWQVQAKISAATGP